MPRNPQQEHAPCEWRRFRSLLLHMEGREMEAFIEMVVPYNIANFVANLTH